MNAAGELDSTIAAELGIKTHQVSYFRTQLGLKGNGVFGNPGAKKDPAAPAPAAEEKPSAFAKPCCGSVGVRHKKDCPEAFVAKALPKADEEETDDAVAEEPKEEMTYKCINPSCEKEGEKFQSTNEIPNVMCHDCGEREVVQVFEE
jgi:DNA-directed RNA polymerase subunit RPC12/RpoP